jgi:hypothetical protein
MRVHTRKTCRRTCVHPISLAVGSYQILEDKHGEAQVQAIVLEQGYLLVKVDAFQANQARACIPPRVLDVW